jgi:hypothetical protein
MVIHSFLAFTLNQASLHCIVVTILVTVYCRLDCVMFGAFLVTRMTVCRNIESDNKMFLLTISNNMHIENIYVVLTVLLGMYVIIVVNITM